MDFHHFTFSSPSTCESISCCFAQGAEEEVEEEAEEETRRRRRRRRWRPR
jgi:hypothetical protein